MSKMKTDSAVVEKAAELQGTIITLQSAIMTIQSQYQLLLSEKDELKQQLMNIINWDAETAKYQLTEVSAGAFVYSLTLPQLKQWDS